jgi:hypothetical protein
MIKSRGCKFAERIIWRINAQKSQITGKKIFGEYGRGINLIQCWLDHSSRKAELLLIQRHSTFRREQTYSLTRRQITIPYNETS